MARLRHRRARRLHRALQLRRQRLLRTGRRQRLRRARAGPRASGRTQSDQHIGCLQHRTRQGLRLLRQVRPVRRGEPARQRHPGARGAAGGSGEIGYADLYAGINAKAQGFNLKLVANNNTNAKQFPILVQADGPIKTPADLAGKTIALPPVPQHTVNLRGFLKANGVDPNQVKYSIVQAQAAAPQALASNSVDAFFGQWNQAYTNEGQPGAYNFRVLGNPDSSQWSNLKATTAAFWATGEWLENPEHQAVAHAFDKALHASYVWFKTLTPEKLQPILLKYQQIDLSKLTGGDPQKVDNLLTNTQPGPFDFDATQSWYELGLQYAPDKIQKGVDLHDLVFPSALQPEPELIQPPVNAG